jgi:hypothetical protein
MRFAVLSGADRCSGAVRLSRRDATKCRSITQSPIETRPIATGMRTPTHFLSGGQGTTYVTKKFNRLKLNAQSVIQPAPWTGPINSPRRFRRCAMTSASGNVRRCNCFFQDTIFGQLTPRCAIAVADAVWHPSGMQRLMRFVDRRYRPAAFDPRLPSLNPAGFFDSEFDSVLTTEREEYTRAPIGRRTRLRRRLARRGLGAWGG